VSFSFEKTFVEDRNRIYKLSIRSQKKQFAKRKLEWRQWRVGRRKPMPEQEIKDDKLKQKYKKCRACPQFKIFANH